MRIIHTGDQHINGKNIEKAKEAFRQFVAKCKEIEPEAIVFSGDLFDRSNVADRVASVGDLQGLILNVVHELNKNTKLIFINGNHDRTGQKQGCLEFLKKIKNVTVVDKPIVYVFEGVKIGCIPFIDKGVFSAKHCVGVTKSEADAKFTKAIGDMLGYFKANFTEETTNLLFGHLDVQGVKVNEGYQTQGGQSFAFTTGQLKATGAQYVGLSHIHKRIAPYVGSLFQSSHSDEGNTQGYDLITINNGQISEAYITLDLPEFSTININSIQDLHFDYQHGWSYKLRYYSEDAFNSDKAKTLNNNENVEVEKLWNKSKYVARTERELSASMSVPELLGEYTKINALPAGITEKELQEVVANG